METKEKKNIIFLRLYPDEDLNEKIKEACRIHDIKTGVVISGIGQLKKAKLGYFKGKGDYAPEEFDKTLEILSLAGNICKEEDDFLLHLHIILGEEKKNTLGGHFIEGIIGITGEIVILKTNVEIKREYDEKTALKTLVLK